MAMFEMEALSDQFGYKSLTFKNQGKFDNTGEPKGTDILPQLRDMGYIVKKSADEFSPDMAYNTRVGGVVGNKVVKLVFGVKVMEDTKVAKIGQLIPPTDEMDKFDQKVRHYETFYAAQAFRKTTFDYHLEDNIASQKIFGRAIPPVFLGRLLAQRDDDREKYTYQVFLAAMAHYHNVGIEIWDVGRVEDGVVTGKVKTSDNTRKGVWQTKVIHGHTKTATNFYGQDKTIISRLQKWPVKETGMTDADLLSRQVGLLGDLDIVLAKTGQLTSPDYGHKHLAGINKSDIITVMPQNVINDLAKNGGRYASQMAQRDMQDGSILQGTVLGSGYLVSNNLPSIDITFGRKDVPRDWKVIKVLKFVKGEKAPLIYISNTGVDAISDYPQFWNKSATTHRTIEATNEYAIEFIKEYSNLIAVCYGDEDYSVAVGQGQPTTTATEQEITALAAAEETLSTKLGVLITKNRDLENLKANTSATDDAIAAAEAAVEAAQAEVDTARTAVDTAKDALHT